MISGVELLCDNCLAHGPQLSRKFFVCKDEFGDPMIVVQCPKCRERHEICFTGVARRKRRERLKRESNEQ